MKINGSRKQKKKNGMYAIIESKPLSFLAIVDQLMYISTWLIGHLDGGQHVIKRSWIGVLDWRWSMRRWRGGWWLLYYIVKVTPHWLSKNFQDVITTLSSSDFWDGPLTRAFTVVVVVVVNSKIFLYALVLSSRAQPSMEVQRRSEENLWHSHAKSNWFAIRPMDRQRLVWKCHRGSRENVIPFMQS